MFRSDDSLEGMEIELATLQQAYLSGGGRDTEVLSQIAQLTAAIEQLKRPRRPQDTLRQRTTYSSSTRYTLCIAHSYLLLYSTFILHAAPNLL